MSELPFYQYLLKTWMYQASAGLHGPYVEQGTGPALKMLTFGNETVTRPRYRTVGDMERVPIVKSYVSKDDLIRDHKGGS